MNLVWSRERRSGAAVFFLGVLFATAAAFGYGVSTVLRALGARRAAIATRSQGVTEVTTGTGGPSMSSTIATFKDPSFVFGTFFLLVGFGGGALAARLLPLFLSQTIVAGNLVITALLATGTLGIKLHTRDWIAIATVIGSLLALGFASNPHQDTDRHYDMSLHWGLLAATVAFCLIALLVMYRLGQRGAMFGGLTAGLLFGVIAVGVRILNGVSPLDLGELLTDPAAWTIAIAGSVGFYVQTVALQLGAVNGVTAILVVGEVAAPGIIGVVLLGDEAKPGLEWLGTVGFVGAVVGAILVGYYGSVDADHFDEKEPPAGGWRRRTPQLRQSADDTDNAS